MSDATKVKQTFARVLLDDALDKPLDYLIPENLPVEAGMRVTVPVRKSPRKGTVIAITDTSPFADSAQPVHAIASERPALTKESFTLAEWVSSYYVTPMRRVLRLFLPTPIRKEMKDKEQFLVSRSVPQNVLLDLSEKMVHSAPPQAKVLQVLLKKPKGVLLTELLELSGVSRSPVETLLKKKVLKMEKVFINRSPLHDVSYFPTKPKTLKGDQQKAFDAITASLNENAFSPFLLHGITGSGKTEVYLQAITHARSQGKAALLLVPEISLTTQTIERLKSRFSEPIGILHHKLSDGEKVDVWRQIHEGICQIVVGARSAIFSPIQNLGLVIVDEEHDASYKQTDEMPCYNGRDVAVMRAKLSNATIILGSATPALESYKNALDGKYKLLKLHERAASAKLPEVKMINMKKEYEKQGRFTLFSADLLDGIQERFERGEQTLLFLNKRGYHSYMMCLECDHIEHCPHCDITLTYHRESNALACHQCGHTLSPPPKSCSSCGKSANMQMKGYGTEQVQRALHAILKDIRTLRMDADTTRHKGAHDQLFKQFRAGKADVLIGTQMIAKGLHFPSVTLVGILNADQSLNIPDFRASEAVFQLVSQVAGRSGRGALPGEVIIQTMLENHYVIETASKEAYTEFYEKETISRKLLGYPPFSQLLKVVITSEDEQAAKSYAEMLNTKLLPLLPQSFEVYPVVPCGIAKIKDRFRFKLLIRGTPISSASKALQKLLNSIPKGIRITIDVGPLSTF